MKYFDVFPNVSEIFRKALGGNTGEFRRAKGGSHS